MLPGESQARTRRVIRAVLSIQNVDCGGEPLGDIDRTADRQDQAHYPQIGLIAEKGFSDAVSPDPDDKVRVDLDPQCASISLPQVMEWEGLTPTWVEATETVLASPDMLPVLEAAAGCLSAESGLKVGGTDPGAAYLQQVDLEAAQTANQQEAETVLDQRAATYVKCMADYEQQMIVALEEQRVRLVEEHADLLTEMALSLADSGYVP
jgi:hypothetical protein